MKIFALTAASFVLILSIAHAADDGIFKHVHPKLRASITRNKFEKQSEYHLNAGKQFVGGQLKKELKKNVAKNVILFLGDGMSVPTLSAARVYMGGEEKSLSFEKFPFVGMSKTYCVDRQVADSACSATGNKSLNIART